MIAARAAVWTVAILVALLCVMSIAASIKKRSVDPGDLLGRVVGAAMLFSIPLAFAAAAGAIASGLLLAIGAPPVTYVFIGLASLVSFRAAVKHPSYGMEGCTKLFGLIASGYALVWCAVSFEATGGVLSFERDALSLRWLQPPLAALPFALMALKISDRKKRTAWLFAGTMAFVSAFMALIFYPIERGFAAALLPQSDWLRFPLAGIALAALLFLLRLAFVLRAKPNVRRSRLRDLNNNSRIFAAFMVVMGLCWAAARTLVGALV